METIRVKHCRGTIVLAAVTAMATAMPVLGCHRGGSSNTTAPSAGDISEFDSAVRDGDTDIVSRLITAKPDMLNAKDPNGKTPVAIATEKGDSEMVTLLKKRGGHE